MRHGSHAYGLDTEASDEDFKGVAIPPKEILFSFSKRFEQAEQNDPDLVIYDLRKFISLAVECNPHIIEVLWTEPLMVTPLGQRLRSARASFLSKKAKATFSGYALSQLKRIRTHYRWISSPPSHAPERTTFGLPDRTIVPKDQLLAAQSAIDKDVGHELGFDANFIALLDRERRYTAAQREWEQYNDWKKSRNPARAALEIKHGYDTKHATHLVRLLRMCREILTTGEVIVKRPDRDELLAIRNGAWSYDRLVGWAADEDKALEELYATSPLPTVPDRAAIDKLCVELIDESLR